jgi:glycosyltransferase involved in cell wall biosynthesis
VSQELARRGHEVAVICGASGIPAPELQVFVQPVYSAERATSDELGLLERSILDFAPEVLFLLSARGRASTRRMTALKSRFPVVRFVQDHTLFCPGLNKMFVDGGVCTRGLGRVCLERYYFHGGCTAFRREGHRSPLDAVGGLWKWMKDIGIAKRSSALVVASRYMRDELLKVGCAPSKVELMPYFTRSASPAVPPQEPDEATRAFVESSDEPLIFAPARLALPDKGVDVLISALARLTSPFRAVIAGSGPAEAWLRSKAAEEGLSSRVHLAGWQGAGAIEWLYERADIVAFPSVWDEPFGLVGIEAMAHGKPVVAFSVGGVPDWLQDGVTGLAVPRRDQQALAEALDRLLQDNAFAQRLGDAGRARVADEFSPERHVRLIESLFERLRH